MSNNQVEIKCVVVRSTANAILIDHGGRDFVWVPKSQVSDYTPGKPGGDVYTATSIFIPQWLAEDKGLV